MTRILAISLEPPGLEAIHDQDFWSDLTEEAKRLNPDFVVFPETSLSGFDPTNTATFLSQSDLENHNRRFQEFANLVRAKTICGAIIPVGSKFRNAALHFSPKGRNFSTYFKRNLFAHASENAFIEPGDSSFSFEIDGYPCSVSICYDLRFPDEYYQQDVSTRLFVVIANWPDQRRYHWDTLLRARAIENEAYFLGVNRSGTDPHGNTFSSGSSLICPLGHEVEPEVSSSGYSVWDVNLGDQVSTIGSKRSSKK